MVSVFFAFVINGDPTVKQFGVGMGVAVAVDATIVRCLLVPAVMTLLEPVPSDIRWWLTGSYIVITCPSTSIVQGMCISPPSALPIASANTVFPLPGAP